jgi:gliding motility-associated-like protein
MKLQCLHFIMSGLLLLIAIVTYCQPAPVLEWQRTYGSTYGEYPGKILKTADDGYIVSGYSAGADGDIMGHHGNNTVPDVWIVKLDPTGNIQWQKSFGGTDSDAGAYIYETADGGFVVAASAASRNCDMTGNHGGFDFWILRLDRKGEVIWQKMYGGSKEDYVRGITLSSDGGFFVVGETQSNDGDVTGNHGQQDIWLIKIDNSGNLKWQKALGGTDIDNGRGVVATANGGCAAIGNSYSNNGNVTSNHGAGDYWMMQLDQEGNLLWQKALGGSMTDIATNIQLAPFDGFIISGFSNSSDGDVSNGHGGYDAWIVRLNVSGNILWQTCVGGSQNETANAVENSLDGAGYIFTGMSASNDGDITCNAGKFDLLVAKLNEAGQLQWQKTMGGLGNDEGSALQPLTDGSFILLGYTESANVPGHHAPSANADGYGDYWIIKLTRPLLTPPAPNVTIDPASAIVCAGSPAVVMASVLYGGVTPNYQWMKNGQPVGVNLPNYVDNNLKANDQITCIVRPGNVCENSASQASDQVTIQARGNGPAPVIAIGSDNRNVCECGSITIRATVTNPGGSPRYVWMVNGLNVNQNASTLTSARLKDGDEVSCLYFDNNICNASGSIISNSIKFGGSDAPITLSIAVDKPEICRGTDVTFTAYPVNAGIHPVFQWFVNDVEVDVSSATFSKTSFADGDVVRCVVKTDPSVKCGPAGSASSNTVKMHVTNKVIPIVSITASATAICAGTPVNFEAVANNAGANPAYQWTINGINTGTDSPNYSSTTLGNNDVISCMVTADPQLACASGSQAVSPDIRMKVLPGQPPSVSITADRSNVCAGENIRFSAEATNAGANPGFEWILNNMMVSNQSPVYRSNQLKNGDRLFCRLIPGTGACSTAADSSNIIAAAINDTPFVQISPADTTIGPGRQAQLTTVIAGTVTSFQWTPAARLTNPLSLNSATTTALIETSVYQLSVVNDKGCTGTALAIVKVFTQLYMPAAFTPNNDGVNDLYRIPPSSVITLKEFTIYNRWGTRVFITKDMERGWDGTIGGKQQDSGVYVYYVRAIVNGKETTLRGNFMLVR